MKRFALALTLAVTIEAAPPPAALADACVLYQAGRYAEAAAAFEPLLRLDPNNSVLLFHLGKLAVHRHDYSSAVQLLDRAREAAPHDAAIVLWLGNAHAWSASVATGWADRVSNGRQALSLYRRAVALDSESLPARFALMNFYRHVPTVLGGGLDRAYEQAREIAQRDEITGAHARALLSFHEKKFAVAYDTLQLLLEKKPQHYGANFLLGRLTAAWGEHRDEGCAALQRCLALTPSENDDSHEDAQALLAQLEHDLAVHAPSGLR